MESLQSEKEPTQRVEKEKKSKNQSKGFFKFILLINK